MRLIVLALIMALIFGLNEPASARGGGGHGHGGSHSHSTGSHSSKGRKKAVGVRRDKNGKIARSQKAKDDFKKQHPCPSTGKTASACPGYVIDHVQPLKRGGADAPSNMQWQTVTEARAKDKWE